MGIFSRDKDIANEIDEINIRNKMLDQDLKDIPQFYDSCLLFFLFLTLAVVCYDYNLYYVYAVTGVLTLLTFLYKKLRISRIKKQIKDNNDIIARKKEEIDNDKEIEQYRQFLVNFRSNVRPLASAPKKPIIHRSIFLKILDTVFRTYVCNNKALICSHCGANNGLSDDPEKTKYICYACGSTERGTYKPDNQNQKSKTPAKTEDKPKKQ